MKFKWENIFDSGTERERTLTLRAKVYKGWIIKNIYYLDKHIRNELMIFIPDEEHLWEIEK